MRFECEVHHKQFSAQSNINRHWRSLHGDQSFVCEKCCREFNRQDLLLADLLGFDKELFEGDENVDPDVVQLYKEFWPKICMHFHQNTHLQDMCNFRLPDLFLFHFRAFLGDGF